MAKPKIVFHGDLAHLNAAPSSSGSAEAAPSASAPASATLEPAAEHSLEETPAPSAALPPAGPVVNDQAEPPKVHAGGRDVRAARASFIVGAAFLGVLAAFWMLMRWRKSRLYAQLAEMEARDGKEGSGAP